MCKNAADMLTKKKYLFVFEVKAIQSYLVIWGMLLGMKILQKKHTSVFFTSVEYTSLPTIGQNGTF